jgi:acetolactate synthase-1/3 small subunit
MAAELEEAIAIGGLLKQGWKPKRTLIYCAWDAEEPGLMGSTEWVEDHALEQVIAQLDKLINVISITELDPVVSVQRELLLVKVSTDEKTRSQVLETVQLFRAKVVDVAQDAVTIEATGNTEKISALLRVLEPFGILELIQSGLVAMSRGLKPGSISEDKK